MSTAIRVCLQIIVAWAAVDVVFCILWAWACAPTLEERTRDERRYAERGGE